MGTWNKEKRQAWAEKNREKLRAASRQYYHAHKKECGESYRRYYAANREKITARMRAKALERRYGLTLVDYATMLAEQGGVCAICQQPPRRTLAVDHDHRTGVRRGLLCTLCNRLLGFAEDIPERLLKAAAYLSKARALAQGQLNDAAATTVVSG